MEVNPGKEASSPRGLLTGLEAKNNMGEQGLAKLMGKRNCNETGPPLTLESL